MKTYFISLSFILFFSIQLSVLSLHTGHFERYNDQLYAKQLLARQKQFDNQMKNISQQITNIDQQVSKYQGNNTYQSMKLQQGLADQRDSLYDVQRLLNQPFALKPCQKPNLTEQQKTQLNKQIKSTNDSLNTMKASVNQCTKSINQCTVSDQLIHQITRARVYLNVMNEYVNGACQRVPRPINDQKAVGLVDLNDRLFKDNLQAPNWVYGNITQQQYRLIVFAQATKFNVTTCPIETPFSNKINNTCFACPQGSVFSLGERICTCTSGFKFDQQTNQCVSLIPIKPCNQTGTCVSLCPKQKPRWNNINKICQICPIELPIVNRQTNQCEGCTLKTPIWNKLTYQCQPCPANNQYFKNQSICVPCKDDQKFNQTSYTCVPICLVGQIYNKQQGKCYSFEQINGCKCNQKFNVKKNQCQDFCNNGLQWISKQQKCGPPALPEFKDKCKYYQRPNPQNGVCENYCDSTVAWYDRVNHVCIKIGCSIQCRCGQIFDNTTKKCIIQGLQCPQAQFYNQISKKCQINCANGTIYNQKTLNCQIVVPVINCQIDQILDQNTKLCVKKCKKQNNMIYNTITANCQCIQGFIVSTTNSSICVLTQIPITCASQKNLFYNAQLKKCQCMDFYHFDNSTQTCIANPIVCDKDKQLIYSKQTKNCVCRQGFIFNKDSNCVSFCKTQTNMIYNITSKSCVCKIDHYLSPDSKYCLHISQKCLSANDMFYNSTIKNCQCNQGLYLSNNVCLPEGSKCSSSLHFIFNQTSKLCECEKDYQLSTDKTQCFSKLQICLKNPNAFYNIQNSKCQCAQGFNMVNQTIDSLTLTCISICKIDQAFNSNTRTCVNLCPEGYYYNLTDHSCLSRCPPDYKFNKITQQCERSTKICPDPINQYLDPKTNQCRYCQPGLLLNKQKLLCQKIVPTCQENQFYDNQTNLCKYCKQGQIYNSVKKQCQFNSTSCSLGMYFDFNLGKCMTCQTGTVYDEKILGCRQICTNEEIFNYALNKCVLISSTCSIYQHYDAGTKTCVNKPVCSSVQRYDETTRRCIDYNYITSKTAKNLLHQNFNQWSIEYDKRKATDYYLMNCPSNSPFYSNSLKSCVYCPQTHLYYNLVTEKCQNCGNAEYDQNLRRCIINKTQDTKTPNFDYSLDRLVMNII